MNQSIVNMFDLIYCLTNTGDMINQEITNQQTGKPGRIIAKINGLLEPAVVQALYRASQAGVKVDMVCRGICALRPGIPGISEHIRVFSIVDRFLEHSRIFYFHNCGEPRIYIGSADWRRRNLQDRVEALAPIDDPSLRERLADMLDLALNDNCLAWDLDSEGRYVRRRATEGEPERDYHRTLMDRARQR